MLTERLQSTRIESPTLAPDELDFERYPTLQDIKDFVLGGLFEKLRSKEIEAIPLTLEELAHELEFEQDLTLQGIEYFILHTERTNEEIVTLLRGYTQNAHIMFDKKEKETGEKRTDKDSLALMLKLAHLRYQKGRYLQLFDDFEDMRDSFYSPDIDSDTEILVEATIHFTVGEISRKILPHAPENILKDAIRKILTRLSEDELEKLLLLT